MRIRTISIWKRLKPLWLFLIGWAVCSVIMMGIFGYRLQDVRAGLPKEEIKSVQEIATEETIRQIVIETNGIGLEVAASSDIRKPVIQLYGSGYINQRATWQMDDGGILHIALDPYPVTANVYGARGEQDALVMRVLMPKQSYDNLQIKGSRLNALVYRFRGKQLQMDVTHGSATIQFSRFQTGDLWAKDADLTLERSRIRYLNTAVDTGKTYCMGNELPVWKHTGGTGSVEVLTKNLCAVWDLQTVAGDISIGTKQWSQGLLSYNLLLELRSEKGMVTASSNKKYWKKHLAKVISEKELIMLEGFGDNILKVKTEQGNIELCTVKFAT